MLVPMAGTVATILEHGLITVMNAPARAHIVEWGRAIGEGGIRLLGVPVTLEDVVELTSDLADEAHLRVGVSGVVAEDQVAIALAAGAEFVFCPVVAPKVIAAAKDRDIAVIAGAATPTEVMGAFSSGADLVSVHPAGLLGGPGYLEHLILTFPGRHLLVSGAIDVENAPAFLEAGAAASIVDRGVFPEGDEEAALEIIRARASALSEVVADALGLPQRISFAELDAVEPE